MKLAQEHVQLKEQRRQLVKALEEIAKNDPHHLTSAGNAARKALADAGAPAANPNQQLIADLRAAREAFESTGASLVRQSLPERLAEAALLQAGIDPSSRLIRTNAEGTPGPDITLPDGTGYDAVQGAT